MSKLLLTPRWLLRHLIVIVLVGAMGVLTWWQAERAGEGNLRSYAYAVEWPIFAAFVVYVWWKTLRDELHPELAKTKAPPRTSKAREGRVGVSTDLSAIDDSDDAEVQAYNQYLAGLQKDDNG